MSKDAHSSKAKVGIFMPCYNYGGYIDAALTSLKKQTFQQFEVIIADDASSDGKTPGTLSDIAKRHSMPNVSVYFEKKNMGINRLTNKYAPLLRAKYLLIFSPDDLLRPSYLEETVAFLDARPDYAAVTTWVECFGESDEVIRYSQRGAAVPDMLITNGFCGTSLMRRSVADVVGIYSDKKNVEFEDYDLWLRMLENNHKLGVIEKPLFQYRISSASRIHSMSFESLSNFHLATIDRHAELYKTNGIFVIKELTKKLYSAMDNYDKLQAQHDTLASAYKSLETGFIERGKEIDHLNSENRHLADKLEAVPIYRIYKYIRARLK